MIQKKSSHYPGVSFMCFYIKMSGHYETVLEWVRTCESSSESESARPESESESIRCESESIGPEFESIGPESKSESSGSESLRLDSAWTYESNNRKVLYFNPTLIILLSFVFIVNLNFPCFCYDIARLAAGKHRLKPWYCVTGIKVYIQPRSDINKKKESFQKVVIQKSPSKRSFFRNLQFYINIWLFWSKNCLKH